MGTKEKSPQEKKRDSYKRDRYVQLEAPHAFRKNWPKKKARAQQAYRHEAKQVLDTAVKAPEIADVSENVVKTLKREKVVKFGKMRLREWLDRHQRERIMRAIRHRFGSPGSVMTPRSRSNAAAFLRSVIHDGQGPESRLFAHAFCEVWLPPPDGNCESAVMFGDGFRWRNRDGLERVFEEYPELRQEFEKWLRHARRSNWTSD